MLKSKFPLSRLLRNDTGLVTKRLAPFLRIFAMCGIKWSSFLFVHQLPITMATALSRPANVFLPSFFRCSSTDRTHEDKKLGYFAISPTSFCHLKVIHLIRKI